MQYAIHRLGFQPYDIAIFAWSIGGYPATWAAMNYPDIRFVVICLYYLQDVQVSPIITILYKIVQNVTNIV